MTPGPPALPVSPREGVQSSPLAPAPPSRRSGLRGRREGRAGGGASGEWGRPRPRLLGAPFPQAEVIFLLCLSINERPSSLYLPHPQRKGVKETPSKVQR